MKKQNYIKLRTGYYPKGNNQYEVYLLEDDRVFTISWYESGETLAEIFWKPAKKDFNLDALLSSWSSSEYILLTKDYQKYIDGNVAYWYESGQLHHESNFINGVYDGAQTWYRENGNVHYEGCYTNGVQNGMFTVYSNNGQVDYETQTKNGKDIYYAAYWENGKLQNKSEYLEDGRVKETEWYENGQMEFQAYYTGEEQEEYDGEVIRWYENGQMEFKKNYKDYLPNGFFTYWYESGVMKSKGNYKDGVVNGRYIQWNEDGVIEYRIGHQNNPTEDKKNKKAKKNGNVYLMKNIRNGYTKIGFTTKHPTFRERTLQSQEPEVELLNYWKGNMQDEEDLHNQFDEKRERGEWFNLNEDDIQEIYDYFTST